MSKFYEGQRVTATGSYGYLLTRGKEYVVVGVEPPCVLPTFTFPEYLTVIGDDGKRVTGHSHRFQPVAENT